ncbi:MAG: hypothetical protein KBF73_07755 [Flavobacteriales bacterium]|nr:hypothetical protein [Flavobacteriales bacterium]
MIRDCFEIRGTNVHTGRRKKVYVSALTNEEAIEEAILKGLSEPFEINRFPPDPPTEAQLSYATDLGASIPIDATKEDLRAIISKRLDRSGDPQPGLKEFATNRGILFSRYAGKIELYDTIFETLPERDRIAFFIFSVFRWVSDDRSANMDTHHNKSIFYSFAENMLQNEQFLKSLYWNYKGSDLRFFGKIISNNGWESYGGSTNTIAYREACKHLSKNLGISVSRKTKNFSKESRTSKPISYKNEYLENTSDSFSMEGCGCLITIVLVIFGFCYLFC